ncbi:hypothetical protein, partial [Macrococcoides caseolyticum]|uniref:hypothetical protein n=1 Tax=Macrococcoides caseolyticum TaxID=69966 RepID=UPI00197BCCE7
KTPPFNDIPIFYQKKTVNFISEGDFVYSLKRRPFKLDGVIQGNYLFNCSPINPASSTTRVE